ncbi:MAG: hypothetical protein QW590_03455 [Candidatus Bilamarchaeaceae archaeon]
MEKNPGQSVLMKTIEDIRNAEEKYDSILSASKEEAEKILRNAREKIAEERVKMEEEITAYKNRQLKDGREAIEQEVERILEKAKKEGEAIRKKRADEKKLISIAVSLLR